MSKKSKGGRGDYAVGRGKPPVHSRFKQGTSGNPGGRKKGSQNVKTILETVLSSEILVTENGKPEPVPILEALIKRLVHDGLKGNLRAIKDLLDRYERHVGSEPDREEELAEEDVAIIERLLAVRHSPATASPADNEDPETDFRLERDADQD
jgi:hypothetical protein